MHSLVHMIESEIVRMNCVPNDICVRKQKLSSVATRSLELKLLGHDKAHIFKTLNVGGVMVRLSVKSSY